MEKEINIEQELYKHFGRVKDFTLCTAIAKRFYEMGKHSNVERTGKNWKEEPVSEELEEEIENYLKDSLAVKFPTTDVESIKADVRYIARHFADWQKQQDKQWLAEEHKNIFAKGRDSMKQQMMKEAVSAEAGEFGGFYIRGQFALDDYLPEGIKDGDRVKLIIIKEDNV